MRISVCLLVGFLVALTGVMGATEPGPVDPGRLVASAWTDRDGLPSNTILDLLQDHRGYIWLASPQGLTRFDGLTFSVWSKSDADTFSSISARCLAQTPDGTIWVGTNADGIYSWANGAFTHLAQEAQLPDLSVSALHVDAAGRLWVGTAKGIGYVDGGRFHRVNTGSEYGVASFFLTQADGSLLTASTQPGLWLITQNGIEPSFPDIPKAQRRLLMGSVFSAAYRDKLDRLWLGTQDGRILRLSADGLSELNTGYRLQGQPITCFWADREDTLWIGTNRGLILFRGGQFSSYNQSDGLPDNRVSAIRQDREGSVWIASPGGGLAKYSRGKFAVYDKRTGLADAPCNSACYDSNGGLWVGSDGGLRYIPPEGGVEPIRNPAMAALIKTFAGVRVRHLQIDSGGKLWISSYTFKGLAWFDGKQTGFIGPKEGLPGNRVRKTLLDRQNRLWVLTSAGLGLRETKFRELGAKDGLQLTNLQDVFEDDGGAIWLASDGDGVARNIEGRYTNFNENQGLPSNSIFRIYQDSAKRLWFAGKNGIALFANGTMHPVGLGQGLASDTIFGIVEARPGILWLSAPQGIVVVAADELAALALGKSNALHQSTLNQADGLKGQPHGDAWISRDQSGRILVPTSEGLAVYDSKLSQVAESAIPVLIESVDIDGKVTRFPGERLAIPASCRRITINFTALSFVSPDKLRFRYSLDGFDLQWIAAAGQRSVSYTNLSPGNYRFRVQVEGESAQAPNAGAVIELNQAASFWQSFWFMALLVLALVALGYALHELRRRGFRLPLGNLSFLALAPRRELQEERQRSDGLLLNILPAWGVDELNQSGKVTPRWHQNVSVLALELVDFTRLSAALPPDQLITELDEVFGYFDDLVLRHACERIRTNGGSYLVCAGLNQAAVPAKDLCHCAVEMQQFLAKRQGAGISIWRARIGIAYGSVVAGVVGVRKFNFDVFGEPVSLAWQLAAYSVPAGITVDAPTAKALQGSFVLKERPALQISGKPDQPCLFVRYRPDKASGPVKSPDQVLAGMKAAEQAKDFAQALALLRQLDFSVIEAETGHALLKLGGKCAYLAGKPELAISAWQSALQYGIVDRALEKNLSILRQRQ